MGQEADENDTTDLAREPIELRRLCALVSIDGVATTVTLPDGGDVTIGRSTACDVVVSHASVSRHHATLRIAPLSIVDAGSRNGTNVRGAAVPLGGRVALAVGDAIQIGEVTILVQSATDKGAPLLQDTSVPIPHLLELECARSARSRSPFAYLRIELATDAGTAVREAVQAMVRSSDAIGTDGPRAFQLFLPDTSIEQSALALSRITRVLERHAIPARLGLARYPNDGVTAGQLVAHAWEQLARVPGTPPTEMDGVRAQIAQVAVGDVSVLVTGETGVGKELCAEMLHRLSPRANKAFVKLNCAAIVESLIESELFGHERGAFTGAVSARAGLFEAGDGGTVFLDEIGELPLATQAKLLRVLEQRVVRRVGATEDKALDVRFVCATNRVLSEEVAAGRFRADLYYRIGGFAIAIPPLRERRSEIAGLAHMFASRVRGIEAPIVLAPDVIAVLERQPWAGNIRELRNTIERAVLMSGGAVRVSHLEGQSHRPTFPTMPIPRVDQPLADAVADLERERILETLDRCGGNQTRAARALGISRNTLLTRLDAYGVSRPRK